MSHAPVRYGNSRARCRVSAAWSHVFDPSWFYPESWGSAARPVDAGGRGGAWFVTAPGGELVLRFYQRGGLMAHLSKDAYLRTAGSGNRAFAEFDLLQSMSARGLPVPPPVAAVFWPVAGVFYRAAILVERLDGAEPLPAVLGALTTNHWETVGRTLRRFHDEGIDHADLNGFNILWVNGSVYVIDFDKGRQRAQGRTGARWQRRNLERLHRSLRKLDWRDSPLGLATAWGHLLAGYRDSTACP
ncbi:3-deoxy-D-manno-octulosonic acid kinase [Halomonadaceae bacterium KBTZ08]